MINARSIEALLEVQGKVMAGLGEGGLVVYDVDEDEAGDIRIVAMNAAAARIEKVDAKDVIGLSVFEVFPGIRAFGLDEVLRRVLIRRRDAQVPLRGKMGTAWDVAYAALYLASDEARFVTGVSLAVDGGQSARIG